MKCQLNFECSGKVYDASNWNPLLISIASCHLHIVKLLFHLVPSFHRLSCLSRPGSEKSLNRECFGLKLAIKNYDEEMFKFLWNELRLFWNLGHFMACLRTMFANRWETGIKILFASVTTKVILISVNNTAEDFASMIDKLSEYLT